MKIEIHFFCENKPWKRNILDSGKHFEAFVNKNRTLLQCNLERILDLESFLQKKAENIHFLF